MISTRDSNTKGKDITPVNDVLINIFQGRTMLIIRSNFAATIYLTLFIPFLQLFFYQKFIETFNMLEMW